MNLPPLPTTSALLQHTTPYVYSTI